MEQVTITLEQWQGLKGLTKSIRAACAELPRSGTHQGDGEVAAPYTTTQLAEIIEFCADALNKDLDRLSPPWTTAFPQRAEAEPRVRKRRDNTKDVLTQAGILREGTALVVDPFRLPAGADPAWLPFHAQVTRRGKKVMWEGSETSLSAATTELRDSFHVDVNEGQVNGFKYWCLASDPSRTLWELAENLR